MMFLLLRRRHFKGFSGRTRRSVGRVNECGQVVGNALSVFHQLTHTLRRTFTLCPYAVRYCPNPGSKVPEYLGMSYCLMMLLKRVNLSTTGNLCLGLIRNSVTAALHLGRWEPMERYFISKWRRFFYHDYCIQLTKNIDGLAQGVNLPYTYAS